jgi:hypothetical protein
VVFTAREGVQTDRHARLGRSKAETATRAHDAAKAHVTPRYVTAT